MPSDSEFDFLPAAGQLKLTEIQKAQIKRERENMMEELNTVLARVRLAMGEYSTAEVELEISESPDPEYEAEEEERKKQERKMKRKERRAKRKLKRQEEEGEERKGEDMLEKAPDQATTLEKQEKGDGKIGESSESEEDSNVSSDEEDEDIDEKEDEADEKKTTEETWTMPGGEVKRKISQKMLIRVSYYSI